MGFRFSKAVFILVNTMLTGKENDPLGTRVFVCS